jgi:hypothetical protein
MKNGYPKLTLLKIWVFNCKSDEKSWEVISQIFLIKSEYWITKITKDQEL